MRSTINTILVGDSALAAVVRTNIFHGVLPDNFTTTSLSAIVHSERIATGNDTLANINYSKEWVVTVKAISKNSTVMDDLEVKIIAAITSASQLADVSLERSNYIYDEDNDLHISSIDFTVYESN
jgi:hypothetical protein